MTMLWEVVEVPLGMTKAGNIVVVGPVQAVDAGCTAATLAAPVPTEAGGTAAQAVLEPEAVVVLGSGRAEVLESRGVQVLAGVPGWDA
jgi:hypothetical protein